MTFQRHISKAQAAAMVNLPEIIVAIVRADQATTGARRLEFLQQALSDAHDIVRILQSAIDKEMTPLAPEIAAARLRAIAEEGS